jgi:hypothetical protein
VILISIAAAYVAAMTAAALVMRPDIRPALAVFDRPIIVLAISVGLSQAVFRGVAMIRLMRSALGTPG